MSRLVVGPFNRVEGDLEVTLEIADGRVTSARVNSPLYRGFEQILQGKAPMDALVFAPRICGICSVSQSVAAAAALRAVMGIAEVPDNGQHAINLIHACENVADHFTHFYMFFMPDFAREIYANRPWFDTVRKRFQAVKGTAAAEVLPARTGLMTLMGTLAGKWPHTLTVQPGGSTRAIEVGEKQRLQVMLREFREYLEQQLFGDALEAITALDSEAALRQWMEARAPESSDFRLFLALADDLGLQALGRATDCFMSYGSYPSASGPWWPAGVWDGSLQPLQIDTVREDLSHSWMSGPAQALHPADGVTVPVTEKDAAYSWCKAPRLGGRVVETGALARQLVDGQPLLRDLAASDGGNVRSRVVARLLEIARVGIRMETWIRGLHPGRQFCVPGTVPDEARGAGMTEAARGSLGHWLEVRRGRIHNYQIISPTTWNFSPRDSAGRAGALEQALVGAPVQAGETTPVAVQHVVRSFDPCMVCTVH